MSNQIDDAIDHSCKIFSFLLAIAVLINRLTMPSVTVGVDGTLFRHHEKFKKNLTHTLSRLVLRTVSFHSLNSLEISFFCRFSIVWFCLKMVHQKVQH
jgi:hypothetical protein